MSIKTAIAPPFHYVQESDDAFLALFPHRFDYIWAEHPLPGQSPDWKTERRHPLSDRLIRQASCLYGVRFGTETHYCLLDIDADSPYHPQRDRQAISRITAALEPLGLVSSVVCTSSDSSGLHLYFPFQQAQSSWQLALALSGLLENAGFNLQPGRLEVFPNPKPYAADGSLSLFNAHRLPLQMGSYLLDAEFQPIWSDFQSFVGRWRHAQRRNDICSATLKQLLKQARRKHYGISGKAEKFINDLNAEIELGWTGYGQTNRLLGRIAMRAYIFHHLLVGGSPLEGEALVNEIVNVARSLPGYCEWCRHQHEIQQRAEEWARCIENSRYFHFGDLGKRSKLRPQASEPTELTAAQSPPSWNQQQSTAARDRIRGAIADLLEKNCLPLRATARFQALLKYGIGGASLYRHRDLWHPNYLSSPALEGITADAGAASVGQSMLQPVENPPDPPIHQCDGQLDGVEVASNWPSSPSLLSACGGNASSGEGCGDRNSIDSDAIAGNACASNSPQGIHHVHHALLTLKAQREAVQEATRIAQLQYQRIKAEAAEQRQVARMQQFLASGDPILVAEAIAWAQINPGIVATAEPEHRPNSSGPRQAPQEMDQDRESASPEAIESAGPV